MAATWSPAHAAQAAGQQAERQFAEGVTMALHEQYLTESGCYPPINVPQLTFALERVALRHPPLRHPPPGAAAWRPSLSTPGPLVH